MGHNKGEVYSLPAPPPHPHHRSPPLTCHRPGSDRCRCRGMGGTQPPCKCGAGLFLRPRATQPRGWGPAQQLTGNQPVTCFFSEPKTPPPPPSFLHQSPSDQRYEGLRYKGGQPPACFQPAAFLSAREWTHSSARKVH